jgi:hypothetical protein
MSFFVVGITETCTRLAVCTTEPQASEYISTLPNALDGIYYIDGPCTEPVILTPEAPQEPYMTPELSSEIKDALEGDSNDAEHDALSSVADHFGIPWTDFEDKRWYVWLGCEQNNEISERFEELDDAKNVIPNEAGARLVSIDNYDDFEVVE